MTYRPGHDHAVEKAKPGEHLSLTVQEGNGHRLAGRRAKCCKPARWKDVKDKKDWITASAVGEMDEMVYPTSPDRLPNGDQPVLAFTLTPAQVESWAAAIAMVINAELPQ